MRCVKQSFFMILAIAIAKCHWQLRRAILPKGRYGVSLSVSELDTQPPNCEADTLPLGYRRPRAIFVDNA